MQVLQQPKRTLFEYRNISVFTGGPYWIRLPIIEDDDKEAFFVSMRYLVEITLQARKKESPVIYFGPIVV